MAGPRFTSVAAYIHAAPPEGQPHLRRLHALLQDVVAETGVGAQDVIKWNTPFFVEPRFLFAFSAHQTHLGFTATPESLEPFRKELEPYETTKMGIVKVRYSRPLPEDLIRRIAEHRVKAVSEREDDGFW